MNLIMSPKVFNFIFVAIWVIIGCAIIFSILSVISPRFRGWLMARNVRALRHMVEDSQKDMEKIGTTAGNVGVNVQKELLDERGEDMKNIATQSGEILGAGLKGTVAGIKEGLSSGEEVYCKHCGQPIDADSTFCKHCGKEQ